MAIGRGGDLRRSVICRAPRRGPQSGLTELASAQVLSATVGSPRAPVVAVVPKRSRTYFGDYRPGSAQRIPPVVNTGYGRYAFTDSENLRRTLVARARIFRAGMNQPAGGLTPPTAAATRATPERETGLSRLFGRTRGVTG
jgi:hypothetical protein